MLTQVDDGDPHDDRPYGQHDPGEPVALPGGVGGDHGEARVQGWESRVQVVVVVRVQPQQAGRQPASLDGVLDHVPDGRRLGQPGRAGRGDDVGGESHRAHDHKGEPEPVESVAVLRPQPGAHRDRQQEVSAVHKAAHVVEEVRVRQLGRGGLQHERRLVPVEQPAVEQRQVVRRHSDQRRGVAHGLVGDEQRHERSPAANGGHAPLGNRNRSQVFRHAHNWAQRRDASRPANARE